MDGVCAIYKITNSVNDKVYIGQTWRTIVDRFASHKTVSNKFCIKLHRAFNKHGREKFSINLITVCHTQEVADKLEQHFIIAYDSVKNGYNSTYGGGGMRGFNHQQSTKQKISKSLTGRKQTSEHKSNLGRSRKGLKRSSETKRKMSDTHLKRSHIKTGAVIKNDWINGLRKLLNLKKL